MKHITKAKIMLEAAVALAVALVLIMPSAAVNANDQNKNAFPNSTPMEIANVQRMQSMGTTMVGSDVLLSFAAGDDVLPHVTLDPEGTVVVTWTNEPNVAEGSMGIVFSNNPTEPTSWDGWTIALSDPFFLLV
jgi:glucose/arabinose dehydrogenase